MCHDGLEKKKERNEARCGGAYNPCRFVGEGVVLLFVLLLVGHTTKRTGGPTPNQTSRHGFIKN